MIDLDLERALDAFDASCVACGCTERGGCSGPLGGCFWTSIDPPLCSACFQPLLGTELATALDGTLVAEAVVIIQERPGTRSLPEVGHARETLRRFGVLPGP